MYQIEVPRATNLGNCPRENIFYVDISLLNSYQFLTIKTNLFTFILGDGESTISLPLFFLLIYDKYILCMLIYAQCLVSDHTMLNTPVLVRSLKLVNIGPG